MQKYYPIPTYHNNINMHFGEHVLMHLSWAKYLCISVKYFSFKSIHEIRSIQVFEPLNALYPSYDRLVSRLLQAKLKKFVFLSYRSMFAMFQSKNVRVFQERDFKNQIMLFFNKVKHRIDSVKFKTK